MENTLHYIMVAVGLLVFLAAVLLIIQGPTRNAKMKRKDEGKGIKG